MSNFESLVEQYSNLIKKVIRGVYIDTHTSEDLYQEMLMLLHECSKNYDKERGVKFSTYFYISMQSKIKDLLRAQGRHKRGRLYLVEDALLFHDSIVDESDKENPIVEDILKVLDRMPHGNITKMIIMEGLTQKEVSEKIGLSRQKVNRWHKRNLKNLKQIFN